MIRIGPGIDSEVGKGHLPLWRQNSVHHSHRCRGRFDASGIKGTLDAQGSGVPNPGVLTPGLRFSVLYFSFSASSKGTEEPSRFRGHHMRLRGNPGF